VTFDAIAFAQGRAVALLTPPTGGVTGSVDLTVRLEQSPTAQTCTAATPPVSVQGENATYLQGNWSISTFTQNPSARATFGVYKGADEVIYLRENF
jgi:MSHA biogenesis protein MshQ